MRRFETLAKDVAGPTVAQIGSLWLSGKRCYGIRPVRSVGLASGRGSQNGLLLLLLQQEYFRDLAAPASAAGTRRLCPGQRQFAGGGRLGWDVELQRLQTAGLGGV